MPQLPHRRLLSGRVRRSQLFSRLDRIAAEMNAVLIVVAIGLAVLDMTVYASEQIARRLPEVVRVTYSSEPAVPAALPAGQLMHP